MELDGGTTAGRNQGDCRIVVALGEKGLGFSPPPPNNDAAQASPPILETVAN